MSDTLDTELARTAPYANTDETGEYVGNVEAGE